MTINILAQQSTLLIKRMETLDIKNEDDLKKERRH